MPLKLRMRLSCKCHQYDPSRVSVDEKSLPAFQQKDQCREWTTSGTENVLALFVADPIEWAKVAQGRIHG